MIEWQYADFAITLNFNQSYWLTESDHDDVDWFFYFCLMGQKMMRSGNEFNPLFWSVSVFELLEIHWCIYSQQQQLKIKHNLKLILFLTIFKSFKNIPKNY